MHCVRPGTRSAQIRGIVGDKESAALRRRAGKEAGMAVIMASNEKGGVGKSSVLMGLAAVFAARGKGVCVVELC